MPKSLPTILTALSKIDESQAEFNRIHSTLRRHAYRVCGAESRAQQIAALKRACDYEYEYLSNCEIFGLIAELLGLEDEIQPTHK